MKRIPKALFLVALIGFTTNAVAIIWKDVDAGRPLDFLHEPWGKNDNSFDKVYSSTFNILDDGFDPSTHVIDRVRVWFAFADDGRDGREWVDIFVDGTKVWNNLEVDGRHPWKNYAWYGKTLTNFTKFDSVIDTLQNTGEIQYIVRLQERLPDNHDHDREDTYLKVAKLKAWGGYRVPDGGNTSILLGLSIIGIASFRRFRS